MNHLVILFSKRPRAGAVKTRMVPPLTAEEAARVHLALVCDSLRLVRSTLREGRSAEWRVDDPWTPGSPLREAAGDLPMTAQGPGDLGARLLRAFEDGSRRGAGAVVILGSDSPTLPAARIDAAFAALDAGADGVVAPAEDGGYVLVGARRPIPALFERIPWGGPGVLAATRAAAVANDLRLSEIPAWFDIDRAADLDRIRHGAPATANIVGALRRHGRL